MAGERLINMDAMEGGWNGTSVSASSFEGRPRENSGTKFSLTGGLKQCSEAAGLSCVIMGVKFNLECSPAGRQDSSST